MKKARAYFIDGSSIDFEYDDSEGLYKLQTWIDDPKESYSGYPVIVGINTVLIFKINIKFIEILN